MKSQVYVNAPQLTQGLVLHAFLEGVSCVRTKAITLGFQTEESLQDEGLCTFLCDMTGSVFGLINRKRASKEKQVRRQLYLAVIRHLVMSNNGN